MDFRVLYQQQKKEEKQTNLVITTR